tara:strand:- start:100587 stop:101000 length:414 start_codon:yes stop_codon:yes gene_type:complete
VTVLIALCCGAIFGLGLVVSGMVNPAKVLNFLDVTGQWDPTLGLVFAGALSVAFPLYRFALTQQKPVLAESFKLPDKTEIEPRLVVGAAIFGIGWGLAGFCPGPGLTAVVTLDGAPILFVASMLAGMLLWRFGLTKR